MICNFFMRAADKGVNVPEMTGSSLKELFEKEESGVKRSRMTFILSRQIAGSAPIFLNTCFIFGLSSVLA
ncbi:MAG: hypothetical protein ACFFD4_14855 [Candidatus Odinarchaeota archaeon]